MAPSAVLNQSQLTRNGLKQLSQSVAAVELELQSMMGRIKIDIKGTYTLSSLDNFISPHFPPYLAIAGFARVAPGDVFEVQIRHGTLKWRARGKTQTDKTQKWDQQSLIFNCQPENTVDIKVDTLNRKATL